MVPSRRACPVDPPAQLRLSVPGRPVVLGALAVPAAPPAPADRYRLWAPVLRWRPCRPEVPPAPEVLGLPSRQDLLSRPPVPSHPGHLWDPANPARPVLPPDLSAQRNPEALLGPEALLDRLDLAGPAARRGNHSPFHHHRDAAAASAPRRLSSRSTTLRERSGDSRSPPAVPHSTLQNAFAVDRSRLSLKHSPSLRMSLLRVGAAPCRVRRTSASWPHGYAGGAGRSSAARNHARLRRAPAPREGVAAGVYMRHKMASHQMGEYARSDGARPHSSGGIAIRRMRPF